MATMKAFFNNLQISFVLIFVCLVGCQKHSHQAPPKPASQLTFLNDTVLPSTANPNGKHLMVVFIHGTILPRPSMSAFFSSIHKKITGNKEHKSWHQLYQDEIKNRSIYRYQPSGPDGLHAVESQYSAQIAAAMYQKLFSKPCHCYTFGWNGKLSQRKRLMAANDLYKQLLKEKQDLKQKYGKIEVIVIGHSHGGNVALNLARVEDTQKQHLLIDKLVLLGTPIQSETAGYVNATCFKKIYNFYSKGDLVQTIDNISTRDDWSARKFKMQNERLVQVELKIGNKKPGHNELWLFCGKDNWLYRKRSLALSPFPVFVFLPIILQQLDKNVKSAQDVLLKIDKKDQRLCFAFSDSKHNFKTDVDEQSLNKYREAILTY